MRDDSDVELELYRKSYTPEQELWFAVLSDAWRTLRGEVVLENAGTRRERTLKVKELILEDRQWFLSTEYHPGSFLWICDTLDIDPSVVVNELKQRKRLSGGIVVPTNHRKVRSEYDEGQQVARVDF